MGLWFEQFVAGTVYRTPRRTITEADIVAYAGLTGDYNPVHTDEVFAQASEFGGRIAHGPMGIGLAFGLASRLDLVDGTVVALLGVNWDFVAPVRPGDSLYAAITVASVRSTRRDDRGIVEWAIALINQHDIEVQRGSCRLLMRRGG